jgi:hypothetical protein
MNYLVDECFREAVSREQWGMEPNGYLHRRYTARDEHGRVTGRKRQFMHNFVWMLSGRPALPAGMTLDHINRNPADNRLENLRPATGRLQNLNRIMPRRSQHGMPRGVRCDTTTFRRRPFQAFFLDSSGRRTLGRFATAEEASAAYEKALASAIEQELSLIRELIPEASLTPSEEQNV